MTERIDCHSHSELSGHGVGSIAEYVCHACELGLSTYCQTEHLPLPAHLDPLNHVSMPASAVEGYVAVLQLQREAIAQEGREMELICGIEADWLNGREDELIEMCAPFEYVIGSVHYIDEVPFDNPSRAEECWGALGVDGVWRRYFEVWLDMAYSKAPITTFGHPDLPKKFGWLPSFHPRDYFEEMALAAHETGRMVEVNTAGMRKEVGEPYPALELLEAFARRGVDCTVGCDAHTPADVAAGVDSAYELMRRAGYDYVTAPCANGDRRYIRLDA